MMYLSGAETRDQVRTALPPASGEFTGWDWGLFYDVIVTMVRNPATMAIYAAGQEAINSLPEQMIFTEPVLIAAWARFCLMYPGYDAETIYKYMVALLTEADRFREHGDQRQWWDVEKRWQSIEDQDTESGLLGTVGISLGITRAETLARAARFRAEQAASIAERKRLAQESLAQRLRESALRREAGIPIVTDAPGLAKRRAEQARPTPTRQTAITTQRVAPRPVDTDELLDDQLKRYEVPKFPGSIKPAYWDRICKDGAQVILTKRYGIERGPRETFEKAMIRYSITNRELADAAEVIDRALRRKGYAKGDSRQTAFFVEHPSVKKTLTPAIAYDYRSPEQLIKIALDQSLKAAGVLEQQRAIRGRMVKVGLLFARYDAIRRAVLQFIKTARGPSKRMRQVALKKLATTGAALRGRTVLDLELARRGYVIKAAPKVAPKKVAKRIPAAPVAPPFTAPARTGAPQRKIIAPITPPMPSAPAMPREIPAYQRPSLFPPLPIPPPFVEGVPYF